MPPPHSTTSTQDSCLSHDAYVRQQHEKCVTLEERLQQQQKQQQQHGGAKSSNNHASKLRVPLCEALSDLLLTDPAFAAQHNIPDRLWRHCFYSRIRGLRASLQKKKQQQDSNGAVKQHQQILLDFLTESIGLYDYLFQKLQVKLTKHVRTTTHESTTTEELLDMPNEKESSWHQGIVDCLMRLSVQMGDLYRYAENWVQAQDCYLRAAYLGPGHGHAMNQLAVVLASSSSTFNHSNSNKKDATAANVAAGQRAVALYWYVRSLSVVTAPFAIARANLVRLWESNRAWLREQTPNSTTADYHNNKSAQNRLFMAHFCELHDSFFHGLTIFRIFSQEDEHNSTVYDKMEACRMEFAVLLKNSALGDSLLCKMVTVCAFSECFLDRSILSTKNDSSNYKNAVTGPIDPVEVNRATALVTRSWTLWLGTELVERLLVLLARQQQQQQPKSSSLRLLLPLLLLTEYVYASPLPRPTNEECNNSNEVENGLKTLEQRHEQAVSQFWKRMVDLLNQMEGVSNQLGVDDSLLTKQSSMRVARSLNEYQNLRGFAPFQKFLPKIDESGVLDDDEALEVLEQRLYQNNNKGSRKGGSSKSQESSVVGSSNTTSSVGAGGDNADQSRMKVARLLWLGRKVVADNKSQVGLRVSCNELNGSSFYQWDAMEDEDDDDDEQNIDQEMAEASRDDEISAMLPNDDSPTVPTTSTTSKDTLLLPTAVSAPLVYQEAAGGGPALLVPGELLNEPQKQATAPSANAVPGGMLVGSPAPAHREPNRTVSVPVDMAPAQQPVTMDLSIVPGAPKPTIMPPPGFGNQQNHPPGFGMQPPIVSDGSIFEHAPSSLQPPPPTVAESVHLFGDLQTANPFANAVPAPANPAVSSSLPTLSHTFPHDIFSSDETMMDGTPLLDSSLLNSLFMDDTSKVSKNPFAT